MADADTKCPACGANKSAYYKLCWRCFTAQKEEAEFIRGYAAGCKDGYAKGWDEGRASVAIDMQMWRRLQQLCHPDKHGNSVSAAHVATWLNSIRPRA